MSLNYSVPKTRQSWMIAKIPLTNGTTAVTNIVPKIAASPRKLFGSSVSK